MILGLWLATLALAAPAATAPAVDMTKPPVVGPMRPYRFPSAARWRLANGLKVVLAADHRFPLVTARLIVRGGQAAVSAEDAGLADAMAELLTDGAVGMSSKEISDAAEEYGGAISADAEPDAVILRSYGLAERAEDVIKLMAAVARAPTFPEEEVALRRKNMREELALSRSESDFLASVAFYKKLFKSHPYAVTAPTDASIARLNRTRVVAVHRAMVTPDRAILVLVGDLRRGRAEELVEKSFKDWSGGAASLAAPEAPPVAALSEPRKVYLVDRPDAVQASIILGQATIREDAPAYFDLLAANQILGGSFSSRLVQDIRESKGYTYTIGSRIERRLAASVFRVRTPVRTEVAGQAIESIFAHLERLRRSEPDPDELEKAKSILAGRFARSLETQEGVAESLAHLELFRLPEDYYDSYLERVRNVTAAGILEASRRFLRPESMPLVVVGRAVELRGPLSQFSAEPVISVDKDGN